MGTEEEMRAAPAAPEPNKRTRIFALGGPLSGRMLETESTDSILFVSTGPTTKTMYYRHRWIGGGWRVAVPFWVHQSLLGEGGQPYVPMHLMPKYMRAAQEVCPLLPRVRK